MDTTHSLPEWLTIKQAAKYLNLSEAFIRKCTRRRSIPFARIGSKALRYRRQDLDNWMAANTYGGEISCPKTHGTVSALEHR